VPLLHERATDVLVAVARFHVFHGGQECVGVRMWTNLHVYVRERGRLCVCLCMCVCVCVCVCMCLCLYLYMRLSSDVAPSRAPIHPSVQALAELKEQCASLCLTALEEASYRKRVHDGEQKRLQYAAASRRRGSETARAIPASRAGRDWGRFYRLPEAQRDG